jgi:hypothetical protein
VRDLSDRDFSSRSAFGEQFVALVNEHSDYTFQVIMSDEANFELPGCVNKQDRSGAHPNELRVKPFHFQRGTAFGVFGQYFFEDETDSAVTVTSDRYVRMLNDFLLPDSRRRDIDLGTCWFQQTGATAHTAQQSINTLRTLLEHRVISRLATFLGQPVRPTCQLVTSFRAATCKTKRLKDVRQICITLNTEFLMKSIPCRRPYYFA